MEKSNGNKSSIWWESCGSDGLERVHKLLNSNHHAAIKTLEEIKFSTRELRDSTDEVKNRLRELERKVAPLWDHHLRQEKRNARNNENGDKLLMIAKDADKAALEFAFASGSLEPFGITSFWKLVRFIEDPFLAEEQGLCWDGAAAAWLNMAETDRNEVHDRIDRITASLPELMPSIRTIKYDRWIYGYYPKILCKDEFIHHFRSQDKRSQADAVETCIRAIDAIAELKEDFDWNETDSDSSI